MANLNTANGSVDLPQGRRPVAKGQRMAQSNAGSTQLVLTEDEGLGRITVDMQAFFEFSFWIAEELEDLIQRERLRAPAKPPSKQPARLRP